LEVSKNLSDINKKSILSDGNVIFIREENGVYKEEASLSGHSDWVRDAAWAPNVGLPSSHIATCSQVIFCFILYIVYLMFE
jgi:WD40 repeat protein